jgi:hypothetical protein
MSETGGKPFRGLERKRKGVLDILSNPGTADLIHRTNLCEVQSQRSGPASGTAGG